MALLSVYSWAVDIIYEERMMNVCGEKRQVELFNQGFTLEGFFLLGRRDSFSM
jgi:hypothetical protein